MDQIKRQFGGVSIPGKPALEKNPNRVAGGIRGSGTDTVIFVDESGQERHIPTKRYIAALEEQIKTQRSHITSLETKLNRLSRDFQSLSSLASSRLR